MISIQSRIANTLQKPNSDIVIDRIHSDKRRPALHCYGSDNGRPFFSKVFLNSSNPISKPVTIPNDIVSPTRDLERSAVDQIDVEIEAHKKMASDGFRETTASLVASSKEYQVLIWETAPGTTLDMLMSKAWRRKQDDASICACIWQVGDWLRRLHKSSNGQLEVLDFSEFQESLSYHRKSLGPSLQSYLDIAERTFDQTMRKTGTSLFNIPIARIHGDMTPPNILWSSNQNRLHVVDFEHFDVDFVMRDLVAFLSTIRAKAFQPWFKVSQLRRWERSFWKGYGIASEELCVATDSLTTAWLFYWFLPRYRGEISEQQLPGFVARSIYTLILEGVMAKHVSRQYGANAANAHVLS